MNDSQVTWKISRDIPRGRQAANDRAPTIEEIQKLIEFLLRLYHIERSNLSFKPDLFGLQINLVLSSFPSLYRILRFN